MVVGAMMHRPAQSRGFTLVEVLACVLILTLGLAAATSLMFYGLRLAAKAHAKSIGMATALSVLVDPAPLQPANPLWSVSGNTVTGYLNGLWVQRTAGPAIPLGDAGSGLQAVTVTVSVYDAQNGRETASVIRRLIIRP